MTNNPYSPPVSSLLALGRPEKDDNWAPYLNLGFTEEHIRELIRLLTDKDLYGHYDPNNNAFWGPYHAWRVLAQLQAVEAIETLIGQLYRIEQDENDWILSEFPDVFEMIGPASVSPLAAYLANTQHDQFARICAANSLAKIGMRYPQAHQDCIAALEKQLRQYRDNDLDFNGFMVSYLIDLQAKVSLPIIQDAYRDEYVNLFIVGDLEDVEIELGVRAERTEPRPPGLLSLMAQELSLPQPTIRRDKEKLGRNAPCPCGSGKKYKKCCLNKA